MVAEVGVHDDDEVARGELQAVHVGGSETEFAGAWLEDDMFGAKKGLQLFGDFEGAVRGTVVDDDYFPVEVAGNNRVSRSSIGYDDKHKKRKGRAYFSRNVLSRSQHIIGRLRRSL